MPSPLNGFTEPAASPTTSQVGPTFGFTEPPVGSLPPVGGPHEVSGEMPHRAGAVSTNASINVLVLTSFQPENVDSRPDADVHGAVAHREDPAVAGEVVAVAVAEVEVALDPRLVVERAGEVAAHRHAERIACGHGPQPSARPNRELAPSATTT